MFSIACDKLHDECTNKIYIAYNAIINVITLRMTHKNSTGLLF